MQQHLVHKQKIVIRSRGSGTIHGLQHQMSGQQWVSHHFQRQLLQEMQSLFDELAPPGIILRIDSLHLDLGAISPANFEREFIARFTEGCRNAIEHSPDKRVVHISPIITEAPLLSSFNGLIFFLAQGRLPWHSKVKTISFWEKELSAHFGPSEWEDLLRWIRLQEEMRPAILQRLAYQFSDNFLQQLIRNVLPGENDLSAEEDNALQVFVRKNGWIEALAVLAEDGKAQLMVRLREPGHTAPGKSGRDETPSPGADGGVNVKKLPADKNRTGSGKNPLEEAIYTENSGIVLLHPFWEMYFAEVGLLEDRQFRDKAARGRAVLLLHWLATGSEEAAEFDLALQKVLCGLPLDSPLPGRLELSPREQAESENLLRAMLGHWPPLQHSSVEGLRAGFFQRPGRLEEKEEHWLLTIEKKTIDILLEKLPWGFSTIRLPWMEKTLLVEWC